VKYDEPDLIDRLASEYVIGTMTGRARMKFEKLIKEKPTVKHAVEQWEQHLSGICNAIPEAQPPKSVWQHLHQHISGQPTRLFDSLRLWRTWSLISTFASICLAILLLTPQSMGPIAPDHFALVGESDNPQWVISANLATGELSARAINAGAAGLDKAFELWMLPTQGSPQSIGLLPVNGGRVQHSLPPALLVLLKDSKGLAISIEPSGGSPTGIPTGPVVYTTNIIDL